ASRQPHLFGLAAGSATRSSYRPPRRIRLRLLQCFGEQLRQLLESASSLVFVVNRTVRRSPTVISAIVDFAFVSIAAGAPGFERAVELLNRLFRHALVLDGVREIEPRLDARQDEMRACGVIDEKPDAME